MNIAFLTVESAIIEVCNKSDCFGVTNLYAIFRPACLFVSSYAFEDKVGKQCDGSGVNNPESVQLFGLLAASSVRYKFIPVTGVQITIYALKNAFRASFVGIGQRAADYLEGYTNVCQLVGVGKQRGGYLAQRVKTLDDGIEHYN